MSAILPHVRAAPVRPDELLVPAIGLSGLLPQFIGAVDNLFFGGIFHFLLSNWKHDPAAGLRGLSTGKAVQATLSINGLANQFKLLEVVPAAE